MNMSEEPESTSNQVQLDQWAKDLDMAIPRLPAEEHDRFRRALDEIEQESKVAVGEQWTAGR